MLKLLIDISITFVVIDDESSDWKSHSKQNSFLAVRCKTKLSINMTTILMTCEDLSCYRAYNTKWIFHDNLQRKICTLRKMLEDEFAFLVAIIRGRNSQWKWYVERYHPESKVLIAKPCSEWFACLMNRLQVVMIVLPCSICHFGTMPHAWV